MESERIVVCRLLLGGWVGVHLCRLLEGDAGLPLVLRGDVGLTCVEPCALGHGVGCHSCAFAEHLRCVGILLEVELAHTELVEGCALGLRG